MVAMSLAINKVQSYVHSNFIFKGFIEAVVVTSFVIYFVNPNILKLL